MRVVGWRLYYGDGRVVSSRDTSWTDAPADDPQVAVAYLDGAYEISRQDGCDEQGRPVNRCLETEHYRVVLHGLDPR
jgi:hypothetical protein